MARDGDLYTHGTVQPDSAISRVMITKLLTPSGGDGPQIGSDRARTVILTAKVRRKYSGVHTL